MVAFLDCIVSYVLLYLVHFNQDKLRDVVCRLAVVLIIL